MNHRDRNAHAQLRAAAHARRARCCTGAERRTTRAQRRRQDRMLAWTLRAGLAAVVAAYWLAPIP